MISKPELREDIKKSVQFWPDEFAELGIIQTHQDIRVLPNTTHKVTELDKQVKGLWSGDRGVSHPRHCVLFQSNSVRSCLMLQKTKHLNAKKTKIHGLILFLFGLSWGKCLLSVQYILKCTIGIYCIFNRENIPFSALCNIKWKFLPTNVLYTLEVRTGNKNLLHRYTASED